MPDGPPLSARERARYRLRLAEDVETAYAAIYADASRRLMVVYAIAHKDQPGLLTAVHTMESDCREAVNAHLRSPV